LPPAQNGIADYAYRVAAGLAAYYESVALCLDPFARTPSGIRVMDPEQASGLSQARTCFVHQLGNNWDHTFVLRTALANPGIVVLHDLKLLFLYESLGLTGDEMLLAMARSNPYAGRARALPFALEARKQRFDHLLFDMLADVVSTAKAIVVHTTFARNVLRRHFGPSASTKTHVIPHFAIEGNAESREMARTRLSLEADWFVVVTTGFATRTKRFDLLVEALDELTALHRRVIWVQAGSLRPNEYDLESLVDRYPRVRAITRFTGYLPERDLDGYVRAADVLVNLRFPSVGESSGSLARALAAGSCCIVSDTAGYRELPDSVVVKIPPYRGSEPLAAALLELLERPALRSQYSQNARDFAINELSLSAYISSFRCVIEKVVESSRSGEAAAPGVREKEVFTVPFDLERRPVFPSLPAGTPVLFRLGPIPAATIGFDIARRFAPEQMYVTSSWIESDRGNSGQASSPVFFLNLHGYCLG
jgi:glycosyltransferase involved in cell wall biosynthesis